MGYTIDLNRHLCKRATGLPHVLGETQIDSASGLIGVPLFDVPVETNFRSEM